MKAVREVYGEEADAAKTPEEKQAVAAKLLQAGSIEREPAGRAALLALARTTAIEGGDAETAVKAVDAMTALPVQESLELKAEAVYAVQRALRASSDRPKLVEQAIGVIEQASAADAYAIATPLAEMALAEAQRSGDSTSIGNSALLLQRTREAEKAYAGIKAPAAVLAAKPADPAANLEVGRYRCFIKNDWAAGLPMLLLGSDADLRRLAQLDIAATKTPAEQVKLGDAWWGLAEKSAGTGGESCRKRAGKWYREALSTLEEGLTKARVAKRLQSLPAPDPEDAPAAGWTVLFRSSDPALWNKDVNQGPTALAITLARAPEGVQFLKMTNPSGAKVIIPMTNANLANVVPVGRGNYAWYGRGNMMLGAYHLGIYDKRVTKGVQEVIGTVGIWAGPRWDNYSGWGFGSNVGHDDRQLYAWDGKEVPATVFEISVKSGPLAEAEKPFLLD